MHNGYSSIFRDLSANVLAAIIYFVAAAFAFCSIWLGWIGAIIFVVAAFFFLADKNPFVRRAGFNVMLLNVLAVVAWLLFRLILHWKFFLVIDVLILAAIILFLIYSGLCATNGKKVGIPFLGKLIDSVCE